MIQWWEALTELEKLFAVIAIPSTLILAIQTIMLIFGLVGQGMDGAGNDSDTSAMEMSGGGAADIDGEIDFDFDGDGVPDFELSDIDGEIDSPGNIYSEHIEEHEGHTTSGARDAGLRIFTVRGFVAFFSIFGWTGLTMLRSGTMTAIALPVSIVSGLLSMLFIAVIMRLFMKLQADGTFDITNSLGKSGTVYITIPAQRQSHGKVTILIGDHLMELDAVTDSATPLKSGEEITVVSLSGSNTLVVKPKKAKQPAAI